MKRIVAVIVALAVVAMFGVVAVFLAADADPDPKRAAVSTLAILPVVGDPVAVYQAEADGWASQMLAWVAAEHARVEAERIEAERVAAEEAARVEAARRAPTSTRSTGSVTPADGDWLDRLAQCECGGNPACNTGNGFYGTFQFMLGTWRSVGGEGYPHEATYEEQKYRAGLLLERASAASQFPGCTAKLGNP